MVLNSLPTLSEANIAGTRVLLRLDLNIAVSDGVIKNGFRIRKALPTLEYLYERGAEITVISHHSDSEQTLHPAARALNEHLPAVFIRDPFAEDAFSEARAAEAHAGKPFIRVCENIRQWDGEVENNDAFARQLASLGDVFVNDAFSASHREHASIVGVPHFLPSFIGFLFEEEIKNLSTAFDPEHPFVFVLGGAKPATKIPLIKRFADTADTLFIGGAVAHSFWAALGYEIGESLYRDVGDKEELRALAKHSSIQFPQDVIVRNPEGVFEKEFNEVMPHDTILDAGVKTRKELGEIIREARFVLWNGPLGDYLQPGFEHGTTAFARALAESSARTIVGGGDTLTLLANEGLADAFEFVSTGGGAMLSFLATETLPGIEAIKARGESL